MAMMVGVAGSVWLPVRGAVRAFAGFATFSHAHIRGLAIPMLLFVARPLSKVECVHLGVGAQATNRGVVCASRDTSDRLANRNRLSVSVSQS